MLAPVSMTITVRALSCNCARLSAPAKHPVVPRLAEAMGQGFSEHWQRLTDPSTFLCGVQPGSVGLAFSNIWARLFGKQEVRILMVGLDAAGKTTILYKLKFGEVVTTNPTVGFNIEKVEYKNIIFTVWDVGGQHKIRQIWQHYYQSTDALIFVVDSSDRTRIEEAHEELVKMLNKEEVKNAVLLVFANKQDLPSAMSTAELIDALGLHNLQGREWFVQHACATNGEGLYDGLDWLTSALASRR